MNFNKTKFIIFGLAIVFRDIVEITANKGQYQDKIKIKCPREYCEPDTFPNSTIDYIDPNNTNQHYDYRSEWPGRSMYVNNLDLNYNNHDD